MAKARLYASQPCVCLKCKKGFSVVGTLTEGVTLYCPFCGTLLDKPVIDWQLVPEVWRHTVKLTALLEKLKRKGSIDL